MYVIVDIEWAVNQDNFKSITQIAATKVDSNWQEISSFSSLIRPQNASFEDWKQVCYNAAVPYHYKSARTAFVVLKEFEKWLNADDILLFWYDNSCSYFTHLNKILFKIPYTHQCIALSEYVTAFVGSKQTAKANPYKLAASNGIKVPTTEHISTNDVSVVLSILRKITLNQEILLDPPPKVEGEKRILNNFAMPYIYDMEDKLLHKISCPAIKEIHDIKGYATLDKCFRKGYKPCPACLAEEYKQARIERNVDILNRSQYTYAYIENSKVFHKPSCHLLLNTKEVILGTVKFSTVTLTGRMPCKICNPSKDDIPKPIDIKQVRAGAKKSRCSHRDYAVGEKRAIGRYNRAKQERDAALKNAANLTKQEREDIFTLTQPEFAFWAVKGYKTFHIRSCAKLTNMSNYQGFKYYDQAIRAGYIPCKTCKPTRKHDTKVSIPLGNKHRENDTIENLIQLCEKEGYSYTEDGLLFTIETPVGKWRIHTQVVPIKVEHQNIILDGKYHQQPRMFLSLFDTFFYIDRHDKTLMKKLAHAGTAE